MRRLILAAVLCAACTRSLPYVDPPPQPVVQGPRANIDPPAQPLPPRLRIIGTNDFHGAIEARPDASGAMRGGASYVAGAIRKAESECKLPACVTILLDGGDMFQGTAASNFVHGRSVLNIYNYLGYSAAALGNHEFDWSQDTLRALMRLAKYPILSANVRYADGRDVPWIPDDTIVHRGPLTIGIIGISTLETPTATAPVNVADLRFVDAAPIVDSLAPELRARGAQYVIVVAHAGGNCSATGCRGEIVDFASKLKAKVDAIVSGHSHTLINTEVNGIPIVQGRSRGQAIDIIDIRPGNTTLRETREVYTDSITPDPDVQVLVKESVDQLNRIAPMINAPVAQIAATLRPGVGLGSLIADAMRVVGGGNLAIMNSGGVRQALPGGTATYSTLFEVQPFGNKLMRVRVRGADLRAWFARTLQRGNPNFYVSGVRVVYHAGATPGIDSVTVLGQPLMDQSVYTVVVSDFVFTGGDGLGFGTAAISSELIGMADVDAFAAYLKTLPSPVSAPTDPRLILRP